MTVVECEDDSNTQKLAQGVRTRKGTIKGRYKDPATKKASKPRMKTNLHHPVSHLLLYDTNAHTTSFIFLYPPYRKISVSSSTHVVKVIAIRDWLQTQGDDYKKDDISIVPGQKCVMFLMSVLLLCGKWSGKQVSC